MNIDIDFGYLEFGNEFCAGLAAAWPMTRAYLAADLVHTALSHLLMFYLEGYLFSLWKYDLPFYLVH